jgi:hypothetical protein
MRTLILWLGLLQAASPRQTSGQSPRLGSGRAANKVEIVSVTGCLKESAPNSWTVVSASDPVPSGANAPSAKEISPTPPVGKNAFALIGVSEFNLPSHRDHTVIIKGLFIKATPMSRVNMTSVTTVSPSCAQAAK